jgi:hypothetical protein
MEKEKVYARLEKKDVDNIREFGKKYNMTKSGMIGLCTMIGFNYLRALINPESYLTPEMMADVMVEAEKRGVEFKLPNDELGKYDY